MLNKFFSKKLNIIIFLVLISICIFSLVIIVQNKRSIRESTWNYWFTGDERRGELVIKYTIEENRNKEYFEISFIDIPHSTPTLTN
jgi:hypothetical protein